MTFDTYIDNNFHTLFCNYIHVKMFRHVKHHVLSMSEKVVNSSVIAGYANTAEDVAFKGMRVVPEGGGGTVAHDSDLIFDEGKYHNSGGFRFRFGGGCREFQGGTIFTNLVN